MTRAQQRLTIAAGLLNLKPGADVMAKINTLPADERAKLKSRTDWVEDYQNARKTSAFMPGMNSAKRAAFHAL